MSFTNDLLDGIAQHLADSGCGVFDPNAPYDGTHTAICVGARPEEPPTIIALTKYDSDDHVKLNDSTVYVQAWMRAGGYSSTVVDAIADQVFDALQGLSNVTLNGCRVIGVSRTITAPIGQDQNARYQRADSYEIFTNQPTSHRGE
jgi:minor capsid protein